MSQRQLIRLVLAVFFAVSLAVAAPAQAQAADFTAPGAVWNWLGSLWEKGASIVQSWSADSADAGPGIDPNGNGTTANPNRDTSQGEAGPGIDPNGD